MSRIFQEGERVRVVKPDYWNNGKVGTVKSHHPNGIVNVVFDASPRDHVSGVWHEDLRLVLTEGEEIDKLADEIQRVDPERFGDWGDAAALALKLYEKGVRHDGVQ